VEHEHDRGAGPGRPLFSPAPPSLGRVALIHYTCPPIIGGVEGLLRVHARLFVEHGYTVAVFAGRGRQFDRRVPVHLEPLLDSKHPAVLAIGAELGRGEVTARFFALRDRLVAWGQAVLAAFDTVIVHNAFSLHFNLPLTAALHALADASGAPGAGPAAPRFIAWCHDLSWANPLYRPLLREAYPWTLLKTCHPAVRYVVVSHDRQRELAALAGVPAAQLAVVPAGVELADWFRFRRATRRLLAQLDLAPEELVLLLPARLTRRKNVELAIRVVAALRALGERPRLLITGPPGPHDARANAYLDELQRLRTALGVEREVVFLHPYRLTDAMIADLYQVADVLLLPSRQEGFGIPLLEAGLARLPVFCTDLPPLREIAGDRVAGYFAPDEAPAELARRLVEFLARDPATRLRRRVRQAYAWNVVFPQAIAPLLMGGPLAGAPPTAPAEHGGCSPGVA